MKEELFKKKIESSGLDLKRQTTKILQINIGKLCNLACHHCHVESGPLRTENMNEKTAFRVIELIKNSPKIETVDLTGGAPELNPYFRMIVTAAKEFQKEVIVRCNITVLYEKGQEDTAYFFKVHKVKVVASLPCYSKENVEKQRGRGVFDKSIEGLKMLNNLGYGVLGTGLILDLVYNPGGAFLPPDQNKLENDYKRELKELFNIDFNNLYTITNMPIKRFLDDLKRQEKLDAYYELLINNFNPSSVSNIMCKNLISISNDGFIFDCDFNQMLELPITNERKNIWDIVSFDDVFEGNEITTGKHCYACTAGAGSSCSGSISK
jgi:radical SAM/Cys-rich protein